MKKATLLDHSLLRPYADIALAAVDVDIGVADINMLLLLSPLALLSLLSLLTSPMLLPGELLLLLLLLMLKKEEMRRRQIITKSCKYNIV